MTTMIMIEGPSPKFEIEWECENCQKKFKATKKFEKNKNCPECGEMIDAWLGDEDSE